MPHSTVKSTARVAAAPKLMAGAIFGLAFGFLLQKGGVGKFNVLIGQLLLQDFTVAKVMLTAIVVGMVGIFTLHHFAKVNLHIKPTRIGANIIGGLLFGAGFALMGYCPGTAAVALGQGSWDALFGMAGLVAGSWIFAELSGWTKRTIEKWGDLGKVLLPDLLHPAIVSISRLASTPSARPIRRERRLESGANRRWRSWGSVTSLRVERSAPAEKVLPLPVTISTRTSRSSRTWCSNPSNSSTTSSLSGLRFSGRLKISVATRPLFLEQETSRHCAFLLSPPSHQRCRDCPKAIKLDNLNVLVLLLSASFHTLHA